MRAVPRYRTDECTLFVLGQGEEASKVVGYVSVRADLGKDVAIFSQRRNLRGERHGGGVGLFPVRRRGQIHFGRLTPVFHERVGRARHVLVRMVVQGDVVEAFQAFHQDFLGIGAVQIIGLDKVNALGLVARTAQRKVQRVQTRHRVAQRRANNLPAERFQPFDSVVVAIVRHKRDINIAFESVTKVFQTQPVVDVLGFADRFSFVANTIIHF